jgi:hypothetical protein
MTILFAYFGSLCTPHGWPIRLMYVTEAAFVVVALACVFVALSLRRSAGTQLRRDVIAGVGGIAASFGLIMPFELAPFSLALAVKSCWRRSC